MKKSGHPPYQEVLFVDSSTGFKFVCGSTLQPKEREVYQGKEYPVYKMSISSASHPFYTGASQFVDTEGRMTKFTKKYALKRKQAEEATKAPAPEPKKKPRKKTKE